MARICKTVNYCQDCDYIKHLQSRNDNTYNAAVCSHDKGKFLLIDSGSDTKHLSIPIPDSCPLEQYVTRKEDE